MLTEKQASKFWSKVAAGPGGCIVWTAAKTSNGYGVVRVSGEYWRAHRLAYWLGHGQQVPAGMQVDHLCRRRDCVNYVHLQAVTQQENMRRAWEHNTPTQCPQGHLYSTERSRYTSGGKRWCAECKRQRARARRQSTAV